MKNNKITFLRKRAAICTVIPLFYFMSASISVAKHDHEVNAPEFSNPAELGLVPKDWNNDAIKHTGKFKNHDLVISLGQQSYPIFHDLVIEYAKKKNLKIAVQYGTCGITSGRLLRKKVDVGAFCCPPAKSDRLPQLQFHSLGISPMALIVHPDNPIRDVSREHAKSIFQGRVTHWQHSPVNKGIEANQANSLIKPVGRLHCKIRPGHWRKLLANEDKFSPRLFEVGVIADMISQVAANKGAIGWEVPLMVEHHKQKGRVRMLKIDGHHPTELEYVRSGKYPLYRSYSLATWNNGTRSNKLAIQLIQYLQNYMEEHYKTYNFIPPSQLKQAGWKFHEDELIGEPEQRQH